MKKILISFYFILFFLILSAPMRLHATTDPFSIQLSNTEEITASYGQSFIYDVTLLGADMITGYQLKLNYNPNWYQLKQVIIDEEIISQTVFNTNTHGSIIISFSSVLDPIETSSVLFSVELELIADLPLFSFSVFEIDPYYNNEFTKLNEMSEVITSHNISSDFSPVTVLEYGDFNQDGQVTIADANMIQLYLAQLSDPSINEVSRYDINRDGDVNLIDVAQIQLYISELIDHIKPVESLKPVQPSINEEETLYARYEEDFDPLFGLVALSSTGINLIDQVEVFSSRIDFDQPGIYLVKYQLTEGTQTVEFLRYVIVLEKFQPADYQDGIDLSYLPAEQKAIFFAAAERYLLSNVYGGVPLYRQANYNMYDDRVDLFSSMYNGVMGFGLEFSSLNLDDSHVLFAQDTYGNVGEYTLRDAYVYEPSNLNPWIADDPSSYDFINLFSGDLYDFAFDESKTGYQIIPNLALSEPTPVNPVEMNGQIYSDIWQIELRDDLSWKFHPSTNLSLLASGYQNLDATDFLWTFKEAIDQEWFRAISGGSDFISQGIKNVEAYVNGSVPWSEVGLRLSDDNPYILELEYSNLKSEFDIKYNFSSGYMQPINKELYEALGGVSGYGMSAETVASSGVYYLDYWNENDEVGFKINDLYPHQENYHYSGISFKHYDSDLLIFQAFLDGYLDYTNVPYAEIYNHISDERMVAIPQTTVWRLSMNAFGTEENRDQYITDHPEVYINPNFVPEPILMYKQMRQAFYLGIDRNFSQQGLITRYVPEHMLIPETYFIDGYSGISVRGTDIGQAVYDDYFFENYGYSPEYALQLFKHAVYMAIEDGYYEAGTENDYTTIELAFTYSSSGNTYVQAIVNNIINQYETLFVDDENYINIDIIVYDVAFPSSYQDFNQTANTDLGLVGISGSILGPFNYLETFCDDNRSGFTLNWGIDTSSANIDVEYVNLEGKLVHEIWSFNAITAALQGLTYVKDGREQDSWDEASDLIEVYLSLEDDQMVSFASDTEIAEALLGNLDDLADEKNVDEIVSFISISEQGHHDLFVLGIKDGLYHFVDRKSLSMDLIDSIERFIFREFAISVQITQAQGPLTDEEIVQNEYLTNNYNYNSKIQVALDSDVLMAYVSINEVEVYATTVDYFGSVWDDVTVVLHIGDYYIPWKWL